ncbi:MAG TPA: low affinity iron permease family protein [Thermoanaerobaculia bacterium]|jgi:low affinity Fe/Cu permease
MSRPAAATRSRAKPLPGHATKRETWAERFSRGVTDVAGGTYGFVFALAVVLAWALTGPLFGFSDTWQLVINTGTTIVTFLMVFLIQRQQNKDSRAMHLKLNELVAAVKGSSNRLIDVESLSERDIRILHEHYKRLAELAASEADPARTHSIEEAERRHKEKRSA